MLQLRDPEEGGPEDEEEAAGGAAALLVPGGPEPPFSAAPPRQKLRPLNVRTASRAGRLKEYFVFRVGPGPPQPRSALRSPLTSRFPPPAARHHRAGGQRDPRRRDAHGGRRRGERVAAHRVSTARPRARGSRCWSGGESPCSLLHAVNNLKGREPLCFLCCSISQLGGSTSSQAWWCKAKAVTDSRAVPRLGSALHRSPSIRQAVRRFQPAKAPFSVSLPESTTGTTRRSASCSSPIGPF